MAVAKSLAAYASAAVDCRRTTASANAAAVPGCGGAAAAAAGAAPAAGRPAASAAARPARATLLLQLLSSLGVSDAGGATAEESSLRCWLPGLRG